ncbi:MAG: endonuclease/exonuclease/phosphatase family protein [Gammaproteobacteria bacterium]
MRRWLGSLLITLLWIGVSGCVSHRLSPDPNLQAHDAPRQIVPAAMSAPALTVMTINLAHGRGDGVHQVLQDGARARENLDAVAALVKREQPQVVALQEADGPSAWSGAFDHVSYLTRRAGLSWSLQVAHAEGAGLQYGTGLMSGLPVTDTGAYTFAPAAGTLPKGFSLITVRWTETGELVDLASVHLEPLRAAVRQQQTQQLIAALADRGRPLVMMGDFNTEWGHDDGVLERIAEDLRLQAYAADDPGLATFPRLSRRLDWILVSRHFEFVSYRVLPDPISDHRAVVAELRARKRADDPVAGPSPAALADGT